MRRAVILAAGSAHRLKPLTNHLPKCLVPVNGEPILFRALRTLERCHVRQAVIVVGHLKERIHEALANRFPRMAITYVDAPLFERTNNIQSLWEAREYCDEDLLLLEGDVLFEAEVLQRLLAHPGSSLAVSAWRSWHMGTAVRTSSSGRVSRFLLASDQGAGLDYHQCFKTVNIYRLRKSLLLEQIVPALSKSIQDGRVDAFYESVFADLVARNECELSAIDVSDRLWCEVDDHRDLARAKALFGPPLERYERVEKLHGGYWREGLTDHSYLYNPYFPSDELIAEMRQDLHEVITNYPVGQSELACLLAEWTGASPEQLVVGNGASELIRAIGTLVDRLTIPVPTFNEYEEVVDTREIERVTLDPETFELDIDLFAETTIRSNSNVAVVVTPNNPTSISVPRDDLLRLLDRLECSQCMVVVDESFVEFSRRGERVSLAADIHSFPNLVVLKSLSKVFGVAGLRLGYLLTSNAAFAETVRRRLPIWNVNGLAEAFLRALPRYRAEFDASCRRVRDDCDAFYELLARVPGLRVYPTDANFLFCRIEIEDLTGPDLVRRLLTERNLLIKDCAGKTMPAADRYVRIACRTPQENRRLADALMALNGRLRHSGGSNRPRPLPAKRIGSFDELDEQSSAVRRSH